MIQFKSSLIAIAVTGVVFAASSASAQYAPTPYGAAPAPAAPVAGAPVYRMPNPVAPYGVGPNGPAAPYGAPYGGPFRGGPFNGMPFGGNGPFNGGPFGGNGPFNSGPFGGNGMPFGGGGMPFGGGGPFNNGWGNGNGGPMNSLWNGRAPWADALPMDGPWNKLPFRNNEMFDHDSPLNFPNWVVADPKETGARAWEHFMNTPHRMGEMPGGWKAPQISVPNPVDVGDEFRDAVTNDLPDQMNNFKFRGW